MQPMSQNVPAFCRTSQSLLKAEASHSGRVRKIVTNLSKCTLRTIWVQIQILYKAEGSHSGLVHVPGKDESGKPDREFESLTLRLVQEKALNCKKDILAASALHREKGRVWETGLESDIFFSLHRLEK